MRFSIKDVFENSFVVSISPDRIKCMGQVFDHYGLARPRVYDGFRNNGLKPLFQGG